MSEKWWQEAIIYQIYPKSFRDSNNDSIGDLAGITSRLDYVASLGVNTLWLNPIFISPQVDDGYDISNYYAIDPLFGTDEEVETFIREAHKRGLKIIFDLVINHTSSQHPWFQEALKGPDNIYRDYYLWHPGDEEGDIPNNWASFFGGSVWEKEPLSGEYYFHLFAKEMPDLNWENHEVRHGMLEIAKYWLLKGIDGFRLDAFIHLAKADFNLQVPGIKPGEIALAEDYYANLPKVQDYLAEFIRELRQLKPDVFILGEAASATVALAYEYTDKQKNQCDAVVSFRYFTEKKVNKMPGIPAAIQKGELVIPSFKESMVSWQNKLISERYPTLYWNNHDMPRLVSRFGDEENYRSESSKMLATLMYLQRGIPIILYGEEIGMKNLEISDVTTFQDPQAQAYYHEMLANGLSQKTALKALASVNKEASRGAMQWDSSDYAGFSEVAPWSDVNVEPDYNVAKQEENPDSILAYYRQLLKLKQDVLFTQGEFELLSTADNTYVYTRRLGTKTAIICANLMAVEVTLELPLEFQAGQLLLGDKLPTEEKRTHISLSSYGVAVIQGTR